MTSETPEPSEKLAKAAAPRLTRLSPEVREELVAYLDGECTEETARSIDQLLATNEVARREVERLSTAYDLLDHLPRPAASSDFSEQTMKSVESIAPTVREEPIDFQRHVRPWVPLCKISLLSLACTFAGLFAGKYAFADPSMELLKDLDSIENVEAYRSVGDAEFVDWLSRDSVRQRIRGARNGQ